MFGSLLFVHVGQCGLQVGDDFWTVAAHEAFGVRQGDSKEKGKKENINVNSIETLFWRDQSPSSSTSRWRSRSLLIDMECGVLRHLRSESDVRSFYSLEFSLSDVSGAGNNFAMGNKHFGRKYIDEFDGLLKEATERMDGCGGVVMTHSVGGGTGSGFGTFVLQRIHSLFPDLSTMVVPIYPSTTSSEVITEPYNCMLSTNELIQHAEIVIPMDNQQLAAYADLEMRHGGEAESKHKAKGVLPPSDRSRGFSNLNRVSSLFLHDVIAPMRFDGQLNIDFNELSMNLVPFPSMKFVTPSMARMTTQKRRAPNGGTQKSAASTEVRSSDVESMFNHLMLPSSHLLRLDPIDSPSLTSTAPLSLSFCAMCRGNVSLSSVHRGIASIRSSLQFPSWQSEGFKLGVCSQRPVDGEASVIGLNNTTKVKHLFSRTERSFLSLFKRRAHLHHYEEEGIEKDDMNEAVERVRGVREMYERMEANGGSMGSQSSDNNAILPPRWKPVI